jgi:hypothetical protein
MISKQQSAARTIQRIRVNDEEPESEAFAVLPLLLSMFSVLSIIIVVVVESKINCVVDGEDVDD